MKLQIKISAGDRTRQQLLELPFKGGPPKAAQGGVQFFLDGEPGEADWAEISPGVYSFLMAGRSYEAYEVSSTVESPGRGLYRITVDHRHYLVEVQDPRLQRHAAGTGGPEGPQEILAPMPGKIIKILVSENQQVDGGEGLLVIEAMKMQNELRAPRSGRVEKIHVREGAGVESGFKLLRLA